MIRPTLILLLVLVLSVIAADAGERVIVRMRATATAADLRAVRAMPIVEVGKRDIPLAQRNALREVERFVVVELPDDGSVTLRDVQELSWVDDAWPNRRIPLHAAMPEDPPIAPPYGLRIIGAEKAWATSTGRGIIVGILDTGIDWTHPDLRSSVLVRVDEDINANGTFEPWPSAQQVDGVFGDLDGVDNDQNGFIDDVIGYDFVDQDIRNLGDDRDRDGVPFDEHGHGTSVGSVVSSKSSYHGDPLGLAYESRLMALRAFDATGNAEEDDVAAALLYAAMHGAHVVNMSFGDGVDSPLLRAAVNAAASMGCILVASAGNTGTTSRQFPASYDDVIAVAATNDQDRRAPFSSTGSMVQISAPGQGIAVARAGGGYRTVNGTSFAAPFVAAAAALVRARQASWTPDEVLGTLRQTSVDLGDAGWDASYGDGRLQADAALDAVAPTIVRITSPTNESELDARMIDDLVVRGSATSTLFDRYRIDIGRGVEPATWTTIVTSDVQRLDTMLAKVPTSTLQRGPCVVRLVVTLRNGRTLEHRVRISVVDTSMSFTATDLVAAWHDDRRAAVVTFRTDRASLAKVVVRRGVDTVQSIVDGKRFTRTHSLTLVDLPTNVALAADITAVSSIGDTARTTLQFTMQEESAPTTGFIDRGSMPFTGYVVNDIRDVYGNGGRTIVLNDLSSGTFGALRTYVASGATWRTQDSLGTVWIPRGMGDANGDGVVDILCHVVGRAALFQAASPGGSPFGRILFADTTSGKLQAAAMHDLTGDGREELLCLNDSGLVALTYDNGVFRRLGLAANPTPPAAGNAENRYDEISAAAGDFDGDGRVEVAYADTDGDLIIAEWTGSAFRIEATALHDGQGGSGYVTAHDVDGDGRREIFIGVPDSVTANSEREYGRQLWTYRMYRGLANDDYRLAWEDRFTGLRYGIGYRSGLDGGDVDGRSGSEIAVCVFPRLYVLTWDSTLQTMRPMWYREDVVSPRMFMRDMDGNGIADLVVGTTSAGNGLMQQMRRFERDTTSRLPAPSGVRATLAGAASVKVTWSPVGGASRYIVELRNDGGSFRAVDTVAATVTVLTNLQRDVLYGIRVSAERDAPTPTRGLPSSVATAFIPLNSKPVRIEPASLTRAQVRTGFSVRIIYDRPAVPDAAERTSITMAYGEQRRVPDHVTVLGQSIVDVVFPSIDDDGIDTIFVTMPHVPTFADAASPTETFALPLVADAATPLHLLSLTVESSQRLRLRYSEPVDAASASVVGKYVLSPVGVIGSVDVIDDDEVLVTVDPASPLGARGISYYLTVRDVVAASGVPMTTGAGNTIGFNVTADDISDVYAYPHPVVLGRDDHVTIAGLPRGPVDVEILDQRFKVLAVVDETDDNGGVRWDLRTTDGQVVPPGIYLYRVNLPAKSTYGKLVIKR